MRVLVAFDKFKDSLTARQAGELAARALSESHGDWEIDLCPLADGGEGFAEILVRAAGGRMQHIPVSGPRGGRVEAAFGLAPLGAIPAEARTLLGLGTAGAGAGDAAIVEMAAASGLALLPTELRDPWQTTTHGTGQLIRSAAESGARAIVLGVGGSATHDLGLGALGALGLEFLTAGGEKLRPPIPALWPRLARIEGEVFASIPPIRIACDVDNPLLGSRGAGAIYGPQKGLKPEEAGKLESESARLAALLCGHCGRPPGLAHEPGTGAAGGISFGLMAAANARLLSGFDLVAAWLGLDARIAAADVIITGEGRFDDSSLSGKGPGAVARRACALGKGVHVFAGQVSVSEAPAGLSLHAITPSGTPVAAALRDAPGNLSAAIRASFP